MEGGDGVLEAVQELPVREEHLPVGVRRLTGSEKQQACVAWARPHRRTPMARPHAGKRWGTPHATGDYHAHCPAHGEALRATPAGGQTMGHIPAAR